MIVHNVAQGGKEWQRLRAGIPTASAFDKIVTRGSKDWTGSVVLDSEGKPKKSQPKAPGKSEQWEGYMHHLLAERVLGQQIDGPKTQAMFEGNQFEESAVAAYELENDCETETIGFVTIDDGRIGCSPDRLIVGNNEGMVEAKSPGPKAMVGYMLAAAGASDEYKVQLQGQLWVCERQWVDIVAYCPGFPTCIFRVQRDEEFIKLLAAHVRDFSRQLEERVQLFTERGWIKLPDETVEAVDGIPGLGISDEDIEILKAGYNWK